MIAVIFEVWPAAGRKDDYLAIAASLRAELEAIDGFISVERFHGLREPGKYVSLSFWRDEAAIDAWRTHARHRAAQALGKREIFTDFRISVAEVVRAYTLADRPGEAAADQPFDQAGGAWIVGARRWSTWCAS